jgi:hypothetical protein
MRNRHDGNQALNRMGARGMTAKEIDRASAGGPLCRLKLPISPRDSAKDTVCPRLQCGGPPDVKERKEKNMSHQEESRVLVRQRARELTIEEVDYVNAAGAFKTLVCTAAVATATHTGPGDGDGCGDTDADAHFI